MRNMFRVGDCFEQSITNLHSFVVEKAFDNAESIAINALDICLAVAHFWETYNVPAWDREATNVEEVCLQYMARIQRHLAGLILKEREPNVRPTRRQLDRVVLSYPAEHARELAQRMAGHNNNPRAARPACRGGRRFACLRRCRLKPRAVASEVPSRARRGGRGAASGAPSVARRAPPLLLLPSSGSHGIGPPAVRRKRPRPVAAATRQEAGEGPGRPVSVATWCRGQSVRSALKAPPVLPRAPPPRQVFFFLLLLGPHHRAARRARRRILCLLLLHGRSFAVAHGGVAIHTIRNHIFLTMTFVIIHPLSRYITIHFPARPTIR